MALLPNQELEQRLAAAGNRLLQPPSAPDQLLALLDQIEELLANVAQSPSESMNIALDPLMKALISEELLRHSDVDLQVAVAACISEITRITAPEAPFCDDKMKDFFQLIVLSFDNLWDTSSRSYKKRATILETVAKVRTCVIMLDLELDQMIIEMFEHFLKSIRVHHEEVIYSSMMSIMTLVLEESEDTSPDLLCPILNALKKNNEAVSPIAKEFAERVIRNGADKFGRRLANAVNTLNASLDDYSEIVAAICLRNTHSFGHSDENILKDQLAVKEEIKPGEKDPALNGTHKSIACNSLVEAGDEETPTNESHAKKDKQQIDAQSTTKNDTDAQIPQSEVKQDHAANGEVSLPNRMHNSAESSDLIDDDNQADQVPGNLEIPSEETHETPSVEAENPLDTIKDATIQVSIVKEAEDEAVNIASPIQSNLPDENRPKRSGRTKRKQMVKEDTASRKASEDTHIGEVNKKRRTMKKRRGVRNRDKALNEGATKNVAAAMSDSEAGDLISGELGDTSKKKVDKYLLKEDRRRGGLDKPMSEEDTSKYSTRDLEKNKEASLSPEKSAEDKVIEEETPRTGSKRKQASRTGNTPKTIFGKNLIGSKVKVWWPDDEEFYEGLIKSYNHKKKIHTVTYTDGDVEYLNLRNEKWEFVNDDSVLDDVESTKPTGEDASSNKKKKKVSSNSKTSNKREKMDGPPKRKRKGSPAKSGSKSKDDSKAEPESPGNSEDESDKSEDHPEEFEDKTPSSSAKVGRPRSSQKKQDDKRPSISKGKSPQSGRTGRKETKKSNSSKVKEAVRMEKTTDSVKSPDSVKGSKSRESGTKSGRRKRK